jgi:hypothetical protein
VCTLDDGDNNSNDYRNNYISFKKKTLTITALPRRISRLTTGSIFSLSAIVNKQYNRKKENYNNNIIQMTYDSSAATPTLSVDNGFHFFFFSAIVNKKNANKKNNNDTQDLR